MYATQIMGSGRLPGIMSMGRGRSYDVNSEGVFATPPTWYFGLQPRVLGKAAGVILSELGSHLSVGLLFVALASLVRRRDEPTSFTAALRLSARATVLVWRKVLLPTLSGRLARPVGEVPLWAAPDISIRLGVHRPD